MSYQLFLYLLRLEEEAKSHSEEEYMYDDEELAYENEVERMIEEAELKMFMKD